MIVLAAFCLLSAGCGRPSGPGITDLKVGREARVAGVEDSDVVVEALAVPAKAKTPSRRAKSAQVEKVSLRGGTRVLVLAIDGDDARVEVKKGDRAGAVYWIECARLEPAAP
jgi:hypothetical protein